MANVEFYATYHQRVTEILSPEEEIEKIMGSFLTIFDMGLDISPDKDSREEIIRYTSAAIGMVEADSSITSNIKEMIIARFITRADDYMSVGPTYYNG